MNWALICLTILVTLPALLHVLLYKRDPRSAAYWVALLALVPVVGAVLYFLLGINSTRRKGRRYRDTLTKYSAGRSSESGRCELGLAETEGDTLSRALDRISRLTFAVGNRITILRNGDEAMSPMLDAIRAAKSSIGLSTYIFEANGIGAEFVGALSEAVTRGVAVRVIVDDAGTRYSWPPVTGELRSAGVSVRRFMPLRDVLRLAMMNLRNHRKILVVDGKLGFTGGLNIREGNMLLRNPPNPILDQHFQGEGPVVSQMQRIFAEDWNFCAGEELTDPIWFPVLDTCGAVRAIGIPDGPDEDVEVMPVAFFAALSAAKRDVKILSPYFLPLPALMWALKLCVTRGVAVTIVTPAKNNIPPVAWAARTLYPDLLASGCRIFESSPPFDHSKIFILDGVWSFIGSTNWDPRSLRLNFEFNLACHDRDLASRLEVEFQAKLAATHEVTMADLEADSIAVRLRNGVARLFIPLL